jgi:hypothetical protein
MRTLARFLPPLLLLLCLTDATGWAQGRYLVLDKPGKVKRLRFRVGDEVAIKLKDDRREYRDVITNVTDTSIIIMNTDVPLRAIRAMVVRRDAGLARAAVKILPRAGLLYILAATFNPVFRNDSPDYDWSNIKVGAIVGGSALLLVPLLKRTYRITAFRRLRVLHEY